MLKNEVSKSLQINVNTVRGAVTNTYFALCVLQIRLLDDDEELTALCVMWSIPALSGGQV